MTSCHCQGVETLFGSAVARRDLNRYRRKGPMGTSRTLLAALHEVGAQSRSLLDIGGGVGILAHEWLSSHSGEATLVDAASAYLAEARAEAERRGHAARLRILHGDFVELAESVSPADLVTLDRVVCCYPDLDGLVRVSTARSRRWYGLSYPRDRWYIKAVISAQNALRGLRGNPFRVFVHPEERIERLVEEAGFVLSFSDESFVWRTALYERPGEAHQQAGSASGPSRRARN